MTKRKGFLAEFREKPSGLLNVRATMASKGLILSSLAARRVASSLSAIGHEWRNL